MQREWASGSAESDQAEDEGRGHDKELHPFPNENLFQKQSAVTRLELHFARATLSIEKGPKRGERQECRLGGQSEDYGWSPADKGEELKPGW